MLRLSRKNLRVLKQQKGDLRKACVAVDTPGGRVSIWVEKTSTQNTTLSIDAPESCRVMRLELEEEVPCDGS